MILPWLLAIPLIGGVLSLVAGRASHTAARAVAMLAMALQLVLAALLWRDSGMVPVDYQVPWIPQLGISFHLSLDGLSLLLILLTAFLGIIAVGISWNEIEERVGLFHLNLLWVLAGVTGVFMAMDLFLFYFLWELMLIPMYFLIDIWGHENRHYAAIKFFLFTQLSGLLMLLAILTLFYVHWQQTGLRTFDYSQLLGTALPPGLGLWVMLGFVIAFAVKLPVVPFHTWLPDAHTQAPTAGSVVLAGLMLKTGAYGLIRFVLPLFPGEAHTFSGVAIVLGIIGILYGAFMAFSQTDVKRLVAYTSVSHLGFVFVAVFVWNTIALQGAVMQMLAHGVSTGALFVLVGILQQRLGTRDLHQMGGLWPVVPRFGAALLFFSLAALGLPGMGNFVGEFLALLGTFRASVLYASIAAVGLAPALIYALWLVDRTIYGPQKQEYSLSDLTPHETALVVLLGLAILWLGLAPQSFLNLASGALTTLQQTGVTR